MHSLCVLLQPGSLEEAPLSRTDAQGCGWRVLHASAAEKRQSRRVVTTVRCLQCSCRCGRHPAQEPYFSFRTLTGFDNGEYGFDATYSRVASGPWELAIGYSAQENQESSVLVLVSSGGHSDVVLS